MNTPDLIQWLRDNSSGVYRPAAEAADLIERQHAALEAARVLITRIDEIARAHCADYPGITQGTVAPLEQLYAIDATLKGIDAANKDCHKVIDLLRVRCGLTPEQLVAEWERICPLLSANP